MLAHATAAIPGSVLARETVKRTRGETRWRREYARHAVDHVRACAEAPPAHCVAAAAAGLRRLYETFRYDKDDDVTLEEALAERRRRRRPRRPFYGTGRAKGEGRRRRRAFRPELPSNEFEDRALFGDAAHRQVDEWAWRGVVEPDTAAAVRGLRASDFDLAASEFVFVVMGAGAAMGPLDTLLSWGATVVAIDLPRPTVWTRLFERARRSPGTLLFPVRKIDNNDNNNNNNDNKEEEETELGSSNHDSLVKAAGGDLLSRLPELIDWLVAICPDKRLVLGQYAYLDGAAFVRVALAMDALASETLKERPNSALAYLCSPTDVFAVPTKARQAAERRHRTDTTTLRRALRLVAGRRRTLVPNVVATSNGSLVDGLVTQQGPNYFLAKRLQHWRAIVARYRDNVLVSSNVAPASYTTSVTRNRLLAAAYSQAHVVEPIEIFRPETSNVLMTWLLLSDLRTTTTPPPKNEHPLSLFARTPVHGGFWRCGFRLRSCLELVMLHHLADEYGPELKLATAALGIGAAAAIRTRSRL